MVQKIANLGVIQLDILIEPAKAATARPAPFQITMTQELTAIGPIGTKPLKAIGMNTVRTETRTLDGNEFTHDEPVVGPTRSRWWIATVDEVLADDRLDEFHRSGSWVPEHREVVRMTIQSTRPEKAKVWHAEHVWSLEKVGTAADGSDDLRYTARMMIWRGEGEKQEMARVKLVHDYLG